MKRDWITLLLGVLIIAVIVGVIVGFTLWAYDGDLKCLIAECRRLK